ncbi:MAG: metallophosphoesterase, partial [Phycisphaeraceae bacterium]|nr:metallophosphoesterase [Phycisphaeraceae bacterium]
MHKTSFKSATLLLAAAALSLANASSASANGFRYGVLTDTQGAGAYPDVSTRLMAPVVDRFINTHNVDMLLSVGDLTDVGSTQENTLWLQTAQPLYDAGIPVYITRGNHDVKTEVINVTPDPGGFGDIDVRATTIWDNDIPVPSNPTIIAGPGASSMFTYENMFVVNVDLYGTTPSALIGWLTGTVIPTAAASDADHKVLVQHETYFGKARGGVLASLPDLELDLLTGMSQAGIDTIYVGHDHQYSRSVGVDPNGDVLLNHIVAGSNSEKYYRYEEAPGPNEGQAVQINDRVSYSIVDVDGPMVAFSHYTSDAPDYTTTDPWTPNWVLSDKMVFMTNGDQFFVPAGGSFAGLTSTSYNGTIATITTGTNTTFDSQTTDPDPGITPVDVDFGAVVNLGWVDGSTEPGVIGDILILDGLADDPAGTQADAFTIQVSYDESQVADESLLVLMMFDETTSDWVPATDGNISEPVAGGVNTAENYVWATLDHNTSGTRLGVVAVPEPTSLALLGLGG